MEVPLYTNQPDHSMELYVKPMIPVWVAYLFVFTVYSREIGLTSLAGVDYDLISYNFFILYFIVQLRHFLVNRKMVILMFVAFIISLFCKLQLSMSITPMVKQLVPIALLYLVSYDVFRRYDYRILFGHYLTISYFAAVFGIIQFLVKVFFGIRLLTPYPDYFVDSIATEPSHYAVIIIPAAIYSVYYFAENKLRSLFIILSLLLTTSSTAYVVLLLMLVIIYRKFQYTLIIIPVIYFVYTSVLLNYNKFYLRYMGFAAYVGDDVGLNKISSGTTLSFLSNAEVMWASLKKNPLFGVGIGGHEEMYHRYFQNSSFRYMRLYGLNAASAHSLLIRVISEFGLVGLALYIYGLAKSLLLGANTYHRIISIACFSHFVSKAMKLGGYFDYGTPFFAMMLLFNYESYKENKE